MIGRVVNRHSKSYFRIPSDAYIGAGSLFMNPFRGMPRAIAIDKFREYAPKNEELMRRLPELRHRRMVCSCKPKACHGDVLVELLDTYKDADLRKWKCDG